ncbi:MAG: MMPL family transporter [Solirubrobacterales bacterium]|nr:MMPL family transporter [Solirubrobacterales bacterium]
MTRLFALPAGRRAKWVVFFAWILAVVLMLGTNLPGKYADAEKNESTSFLPGDAESTRALEVTTALQDGERAPTVIVYSRDGGLRPADEQTIKADIAKLNAANREERYANASDFGNPAGGARPFQLSKDGSTALIANSLRATGEAENILDPIDTYRNLVSGERDGLKAQVGGPGGISADAIKVFENINGTLILAAVLLVFVLLILIYRSPIFWFFPLLAVGISELTSQSFGYGLTELGVTVNGQSSSIASILVLGAGTDYALLLVSRYREELRLHQDKHEAMANALRAAGPAILASGLTVAITLMSLTFAKVNGTAGLGPTGAAGILVALIAMLTLLPAMLTIVGRRRFWPFVPYGPEGPTHTSAARSPLIRIERRYSLGRGAADETHGFWRRVGERVRARPRPVWIGTVAVLGIFCLGLLNFSDGLTQGNSFRDGVESVDAQETIAEAFPAGQSAPTDVIVKDPAKVEAVATAVGKVPGVASVTPTPSRGPQGVLLAAFLDDDPFSTDAFALVPEIRAAARSADPGALVGGSTAVEADLREASADDTRLLVPVATVIVFVILLLLLRAVLLSVLLIATVVLSFAASLGVAAVVYDVVFGFPGSDPSLPLFAFIFLVALGVDYNIFLMARVREEVVRHGTRPGMLRGLAVTGGVITSAGIVLAGTFSVLGVLPLVFLTEIGFVIAFGVLLDTFVVRSILVPALVFDLGPKVWWPSKLADEPDHADEEHPSGPAEVAPASSRT